MTLDHAALLMEAFLDRTGLSSDAETRRYLWTDAFAVSNLLELHERTGTPRYRDQAVALIGQVHRVLGRHRPDDARRGWLSGLPEEKGAEHPTAGGLRIGKPLPERAPNEPMDERLEWDRDGQYFHYLTKWMDALARASTALGELKFQRQALELAEASYSGFMQRSRSGVPQGFAWKMSIDLSRQLVASQSPHDTLDGYVTFRSLVAKEPVSHPLGEAIGVLLALTSGQSWPTSDPLGLGGLLLDVARLTGLPDAPEVDEVLCVRILGDVAPGISAFVRSRTLDALAGHRLAFRELGLAIGLQRVGQVARVTRSSRLDRHLAPLRAASAVGDHIVAFWSDPQSQSAASWRDHRDINEVMLATALLGAS